MRTELEKIELNFNIVKLRTYIWDSRKKQFLRDIQLYDIFFKIRL